MHISGARYRYLNFFFTNGSELNQRTGQILTAGSNSHGKAFKKRVEHDLIRFLARSDKNGTKIEPVVAMLRTLFTMRSPLVAVVPTVERAPARGPGAQPGGARSQTTLCYASAVCFCIIWTCLTETALQPSTDQARQENVIRRRQVEHL